jgi:hypothetical protein
MGNIRHIPFRRLWLFAGCLALLLALKRSQTRPASSTPYRSHAGGNGNNHEGSK